MRYVILQIAVIALSFVSGLAQTSPKALNPLDNNRSTTPTPAHTGRTLSRAIGVGLDSSAVGIMIADVYVSMPAYKAGLCKGDIVLAVNNEPVKTLRQAVRLTQNIPYAFVMLDIQRRDMRICRRVEVSDGYSNNIGMHKDRGMLAFSFSSFADGTADALRDLAQQYVPASIDTIILDMRNCSGGSYIEAQKVARLLNSSQSSNSEQAKIIILARGSSDQLQTNLSSILERERNAEVWHSVADGHNATESMDPLYGTVKKAVTLRASSSPAMEVAPVHWNMADFRERYPEPIEAARTHPMLLAHASIAPLAWGINGNAWDAVGRIRGTRD